MKKKRRNNNNDNCKNGHDEKYVTVKRVVMLNGKILFRYKCANCKTELNVPDELIGVNNPFGIMQRSQTAEINVMMSHVDAAMGV